ncbi:hypothetical protein [Micromonospora zamorensis]
MRANLDMSDFALFDGDITRINRLDRGETGCGGPPSDVFDMV